MTNSETPSRFTFENTGSSLQVRDALHPGQFVKAFKRSQRAAAQAWCDEHNAALGDVACGCDACEALTPETVERKARPAWMPSAEQKQRANDAHEATLARRSAQITVTDNHGQSYAARALLPGMPYGNGGTWGDVFYQRNRLGVTIDGTPGTYYASPLCDSDGERPLALDFGAGWFLTLESTKAFVDLARRAMLTAGVRGLS